MIDSHPTHTLYTEIHGAILKAMRSGCAAQTIQGALSTIQREIAASAPYIEATIDAQKAPG